MNSDNLQEPPFTRCTYDFASVKQGQVIPDEVIIKEYGIKLMSHTRSGMMKYIKDLSFARMAFKKHIEDAMTYSGVVKMPEGYLIVLDSEASSTECEKRLRTFVRKYARTLRTMRSIPLEDLSDERRLQHEKIVQIHARLEQARNRERRKISRDYCSEPAEQE